MAKTSDAQKKASTKWQRNNKESMAYIRAKSAARSFVKNKAKLEDLEELKQQIVERETLLKDQRL